MEDNQKDQRQSRTVDVRGTLYNFDTTQAEFQTWADSALTGISILLKQKGAEYSEGIALDNFITSAELLGVSPAEVIMTQATKHWIALVDWANGRGTGAAVRTDDIIVYMLLLRLLERSMLAEDARMSRHEDSPFDLRSSGSDWVPDIHPKFKSIEEVQDDD